MTHDAGEKPVASPTEGSQSRPGECGASLEALPGERSVHGAMHAVQRARRRSRTQAPAMSRLTSTHSERCHPTPKLRPT